jgi:secondary thiamine-phosphate synthase enzyme
MPIRHHTLTLASTAPIEFVDLTARVRDWLRTQGVTEGLLTVVSPHTTGRITINELDPALQQDMVAYLERMAPRDRDYGHNRATVDGRDNAHAHILGLFMPASESIPVRNGDVSLGTWQALFFVELDGPRPKREVHLQLLLP